MAGQGNDKATSPDQNNQKSPTASKETAHEAFTRITSGNPRFREVKNPGKGFVIVGARPPRKES